MRFILALLVALALPAQLVIAQEAGGTITTENTPQQDASIAQRLREILQELGNYGDVSVTVSDGVVTLRGTATSAMEAADLDPLANRVQGVVAVKNEVVETSDIGARLDPAIDRFRARLAQLYTFLPLALIALAMFVGIVLLGTVIARMREPWDRLAPNAFIAQLYRQFVRIIFVVVGLVAALDILNATALLSTILGAAGIIGLAFGFAVRDTVENYIASVMLSIRQPFRPNDVVEINGDQGKVIRLTSRATILLSFDGNHIRIPNATVFKSRIINFSQHAERRFMFGMLIDSNADLQKARELAEKTVQSLPFTLDAPTAQSWIERLDTNGVLLQVTGWIDQNHTSLALAKGEAIRQVKLALQSANVTLTDATQRIALQAASDTPPEPGNERPETTQVEVVDATQETALEEIIQAERDTDQREDLLDDAALKE